MLPSLLIIDDFIADPMAARGAALALNYDPDNKHGNYPGHISTTPLEISGLNERVSKIINAPVTAAPNTSHLHCRVTLKGDKGRSGVHIDPAFYSGILYLSLPEHCKGGTEFFRHNRTGLERLPSTMAEITKAGYTDINALIKDVVNKDTNHPAKWTKVMTVPMRFNRLILFSPWMFHNSGAAFGTTPENGRLVNLMFFGKG
jgi:hypothetical protein